MIIGSTLARRSVRACQIFLLSVISAAGIASATINDRLLRYDFQAENAPPYIHFYHFLHQFRADSDPRWASRDLVNLGFAESEVTEISAYFSDLYEETEREIDQAIARIACTEAAASLGGLQIRTVYNAFDDLRFAIAAKYLAIAAAELAARNHPDFVERLVELDDSFAVFSTDHRFAWGDDDEHIQENRLVVCRGIKERLKE